jgi:hypothetical protein
MNVCMYACNVCMYVCIYFFERLLRNINRVITVELWTHFELWTPNIGVHKVKVRNKDIMMYVINEQRSENYTCEPHLRTNSVQFVLFYNINSIL